MSAKIDNRKLIAVGGMVAVLIIIFASHAARRHRAEAEQAKEETLRSNLAGIRAALKRYEQKHNARAHTLADLVRDGELLSIPVDPVTKSSSTWKTTVEESVRVDDFDPASPAATAPEIVNVHSGAPGRDSAGRPWSDY